MDNDLLEIKFDLRMMAETINTRILARHKEVQSIVEKTVDEYCDSNTIETLIREETKKLIESSIRECVKVNMRRELIDQLVQKAFAEIAVDN